MTDDALETAQAPDPESYDSADPAQVNQARRKAGRRRAARLQFVKAMMDVAEGRAWIYGHLERCHIFATPFMQGDPHATSFRCGEHNIGLRLLADIMDAAPDEYVLMVKEGKANARQRD